ncbi:fumarylacetoacetate hydrolase family protein [Paraburkholderia aspalathi]|uniref:2-keto-4-pentenoate hydratase/2-oxohepta-3-ene-1,7-dioic acid hydratase (Catechol pathway) n=1 Tax=Paraburkholderia aspalathi TaxID=1324617 RepID=A0A1I7D8L3_9BURK|nr:fumarylacetoacetate hydrolase family protein [Paraburkholderia aspalathi]SFU08026.1 2-keto-4-pentenoate hydratase/2-oxohepta-3-ene-1,7-dioic acid hydratase (catechol pathway) [Paraburkholderia aspalathi]
MKIARYRLHDAVHYGVLEGEHLERLSGSPFDGIIPVGQTDALADAKLLCPLPVPRLFAVGMNYVGHIAEAGAKTPEIPQFFMMPTTAAIGPDEAIVRPREAQVVHHEAELAIVIGKKGRRIDIAHALDYVFGYTCANDVSERVIQNREMSYGCLLVGKAFDTFCPLGPVIATGLDAGNLRVQSSVNGTQRQDGNTSDLLFSVPFIVSYLSQALTLLPGDVILTGTPSGVGPLNGGDLCDITIEGIGTLRNPVVDEAA